MSQLSYKEIIENQLPEDLYKSRNLESQAIGNSLDNIQNDINSLEKEVSPLSAVRNGLEQWEKFFKLPSNLDDNIEIRRARVVSELIQFMSDENVIRKDEMETILSFYGQVEIIEYFAEYIFEVIFREDKHLNVGEIGEIIKKIKPTWLEYRLLLQYINKLLLNLKTYEFHNKLKTTDEFVTEDNLPGYIEKSPLNIASKTYAFSTYLGITDIMTTETLTLDSQLVDVINKSHTLYNEVVFKRAGDIAIGEGEI
ncbi:putative phage tail protein [Tissierella praeacuta]|uniref:putative phage tail protein n=1 Tax=Tissierella praeacuta TaxID=43131 RepID=UPI00333FB0F0